MPSYFFLPRLVAYHWGWGKAHVAEEYLTVLDNRIGSGSTDGVAVNKLQPCTRVLVSVRAACQLSWQQPQTSMS